MAANSQQFVARASTISMPTHKVNEVSLSSLEQQLANLTSLVQNMATDGASTHRVCGICSSIGNPTDACPALQTDEAKQVNFIGRFPGQQCNDPFFNKYNEGWRNHPNLSYGNQHPSSFQGNTNRPPGFNQ